MKVQATFEYVQGQYFDFYGDDDVWVFINNKLVVDIGGQHGQVAGAVDLDTIGQNNPADKLVEGQTYPFHIFYAERHTSSSNFRTPFAGLTWTLPWEWFTWRALYKGRPIGRLSLKFCRSTVVNP